MLLSPSTECRHDAVVPCSMLPDAYHACTAHASQVCEGLLCTQLADVTSFLLQHFNLMYAYNAMASYFARDNVALLGFSKVRLFI